MRFLYVLAIAIAGVAAPAGAQEKGQVGIAAGFPTSFGVVWQVGDRVAVRPDVTFSHETTDLTQATTIVINSQPQTSQSRLSTTTDSFSSGISGLFFVSKREGLGTYLGARYAHSRGSSTAPSFVTGTGAEDVTTTGNLVSGFLGLQYEATRRFGVYGEIGVEYARSTVSQQSALLAVTASLVSSALSLESRISRTGLRSGVGVVWYFH